MAEMTRKDPTISRELELMRRGIGSTRPITNLNQFSQYLKEQEPSATAEGISKGFEPIRRGIGKYTLNPLATLQDLAAGAGEGLYGLAADASGGIASALGAPEFGQDMFTIADKSYDSAKGRLAEALGPGQVINDKGFSPADNEQLLDIFGPDPSIGRPEGMVPGKATIKPGTEGLPKKQIPDPSSNVDAAARLMMEQSQTKADANREASLATSSGSASKTEDPMGDYSGEEPTVDLFMQAMADGNVAEGKKQPKAKSREDLLEKYKQEFADATGIDISGKPDTSQALMAMGLGLMKNRAGKGFNVGKMLSAVGEAGEKAMPALAAAKKEAKAARIAAGKYALGQIKADEDVESAIAASELAFQREYLLKEMGMRQKDREANYKDGEVKNPYNSEVMDGLNIRMGRSRDGAKYMDPSNALKKIAGTQRKVNGALETLDQMEVLLDDLGDANTGNAAKLIGDRVKTLMVAGGLTDAKVAFPETGISTEDELRAYQKSIVNEFKRFLTQETGNGISNVDIKNLEQLLGDVSVFTNPLTAKKRLSRIRRIFTGKRKSVAALRDNIMDPKYYATEQEFLDNQEKFDTLLSGNTTYRFVDDAGSLIDVEDK